MLADIKRKYRQILFELGRFGRHTEREYGSFILEKASKRAAFSSYVRTLEAQEGKFQMEPVSAGFVSGEVPVILKWSSKKSPTGIGAEVEFEVTGRIRDELQPLAEKWVSLGAPFASGGGPFFSQPNKSVRRIEELLKHHEYLFPVIRWNMEDIWEDFWVHGIATRAMVTQAMLAVKDRMPDVFSFRNAEAGTGVRLRGLRAKRKDLDRLSAAELKFLLDHMIGAALMYATSQQVDPGPDRVWVIRYLDPRIEGALAARSDVDYHEVGYKAPYLTMHGKSTCRQVWTEGSGVLTRSDRERTLMGESALQKIWKDAIARWSQDQQQEPPFKGIHSLVEMWTSHTYNTGKPGEMIVVGEDFGMSEPIKAPADGIFCGTFTHFGRNRMMPDLGSGKWFTSGNYIPIQLRVGREFQRRKMMGAKLKPLGDDLTSIVKYEDYPELLKIYYPYEKIKGTKGKDSKLLGFWTHRGDEWIVAQTPRVIASKSSAGRIGSAWGEMTISGSGETSLVIPPTIELSVREAIPSYVKLAYFKGTQEQLKKDIPAIWKSHLSHTPLELLPSWVEHMDFEDSVED